MPGLTLQQMYEAALEIPPFAGGGIGAYDGDFLHVDVRDHQGALGRECAAGTSAYISWSANLSFWPNRRTKTHVG